MSRREPAWPRRGRDLRRPAPVPVGPRRPAGGDLAAPGRLRAAADPRVQPRAGARDHRVGLVAVLAKRAFARFDMAAACPRAARRECPRDRRRRHRDDRQGDPAAAHGADSCRGTRQLRPKSDVCRGSLPRPGCSASSSACFSPQSSSGPADGDRGTSGRVGERAGVFEASRLGGARRAITLSGFAGARELVRARLSGRSVAVVRSGRLGRFRLVVARAPPRPAMPSR